MRIPRTISGTVRSAGACSGVLLLLVSATAHAQSPAAPGPKPAETPPSPTDEASEEAPPQPKAAPDSAPSADPSPDSAADPSPDSAADPAADPSPDSAASDPATASDPAAAAVSPPASTQAPEGATSEPPGQVPEDDYEGATDSVLVEKKPGPKNLSLGVAVDVTWALGRASNFISSASIQGLSLDLRYYAWGNIGIGAGLALDSLSKKSTGTATWENATITGTQVRELSYTPITIKGYYAWREQQRFIPYVAAGLGAARAMKRLSVGITGLSEASWHFAMVPEAGLQIPVGPTVILTNVRLNYLPPSAGVEEHVFANFSIGLSIQ